MSNNAFRDHIAHDNMTPLWEVLRGAYPARAQADGGPRNLARRNHSPKYENGL